jgi:hypothetical protein
MRLELNDPDTLLTPSFSVEFKVDFTTDVKDMYAVFYLKESYRCVHDGEMTNKFDEFRIKKVYQLVHGSFNYKQKTIEGQVALVCISGRNGCLSPILLSYQCKDKRMPKPKLWNSNGFTGLGAQSDTVYLIDWADFEKLRQRMNLKSYTFKDYVLKVITSEYEDVSLSDETSYFNFTTEPTSANNLATSKGLSIFLEEATNKRKRILGED